MVAIRTTSVMYHCDMVDCLLISLLCLFEFVNGPGCLNRATEMDMCSVSAKHFPKKAVGCGSSHRSCMFSHRNDATTEDGTPNW